MENGPTPTAELAAIGLQQDDELLEDDEVELPDEELLNGGELLDDDEEPVDMCVISLKWGLGGRRTLRFETAGPSSGIVSRLRIRCGESPLGFPMESAGRNAE